MCSGHACGVYIYQSAQPFSSASNDLNFLLFNSCINCRILRNREYVARLKVQKANHLQDVQRQADALKMECRSLSAQVQSHQVCSVVVCRPQHAVIALFLEWQCRLLSQEMVDSLKTGNRELQIKLKGLNEQAKFETRWACSLLPCSQGLIHLSLDLVVC